MLKPAHKSFSQMGFTLVELLIVVSIIVVMSGVLIPGFTNYYDTQTLRQGQEQIKSDLRNIQMRALTGIDATAVLTHWAVKFEPNESFYGYFLTDTPTAATCNSTTPTETSKKMAGGVMVRGSDSICVFFSFDNGDVIYSRGAATDVTCDDGLTECIIPVGYEGPGGTCEWVGLNEVGLIKLISSGACP
jgi:prepilin-type N-terminal cleavage/methylation domain-containing protein